MSCCALALLACAALCSCSEADFPATRTAAAVAEPTPATAAASGSGSETTPGPQARPAARRVSPLEQVLLDSAGTQYGAYADLLLMFSGDGRRPLFDEHLDLGDDDPAVALENYEKLIDVTDRLLAQRDRAREVMEEFSRQARPAEPMDGFWSRSVPQRGPVVQVSCMMIESLLEPAWNFFAWGENARRTARANVLGIAYADPKINNIQSGEQKMLRDRIYEVAKTQFGGDPNVGGSQIEFYQNLQSGKLDHLAQRLHAEMSQDATDAGLTYMTVAADQGKRPIDMVYEEGCKGLAKGVDLYMAAGKAAVTGGLGPDAGKHFEKGWDKAKDACEKIESTEKEYQEFKKDPAGYLRDKAVEKVTEKIEEVATEKGQELLEDAREKVDGFREAEDFVRKAGDAKDEIQAAVDDPEGYLLGKANEKLGIGDRVKKFVKDKTNLSDNTIEFLADRVSGNVTDMARNVVIGETVDKEVEAAGGDPAKVDTKETLRRIKDAGWDYGAIAVEADAKEPGDGPADSEASGDSGEPAGDEGPAGEGPGSAIAVWEKPDTGEVKLTVQPVASEDGGTIPVPGGTTAEVLEVDEGGGLESISETTFDVEPNQVVTVDRGSGETERVAMDTYFDDWTARDPVAGPVSQPGVLDEPGWSEGPIRVDLSQLYPPADELAGDPADGPAIEDYSGDSEDTWGEDTWDDDSWGDESSGDDFWGEDTPGDDADDWPVEDENTWGTDEDNDAPEPADNLADATPEAGKPKYKVPNIKPSGRRFLPENCKISFQTVTEDGPQGDPIVFTFDGGEFSGSNVSHVEAFSGKGFEFYGYNIRSTFSGTIQGNVLEVTIQNRYEPNRQRCYSTGENVSPENAYDYVSTITLETPPMKITTLLDENGKWVSHIPGYSYKWMGRNSGKLPKNVKPYSEQTFTVEPWSVGGTWRYVE